MKIDVNKVAKLANLTITPDEEKEFDKQLNDIVGYIEKLNSVDTTGIAPTAQVTGLVNKTREDKIARNSLSQKDALSGGKKIHNEMFVVDQTVDTTS